MEISDVILPQFAEAIEEEGEVCRTASWKGWAINWVREILELIPGLGNLVVLIDRKGRSTLKEDISLLTLPPEVMTHIFFFLEDTTDYVNLMVSCRKIAQIGLLAFRFNDPTYLTEENFQKLSNCHRLIFNEENSFVNLLLKHPSPEEYFSFDEKDVKEKDLQKVLSHFNRLEELDISRYANLPDIDLPDAIQILELEVDQVLHIRHWPVSLKRLILSDYSDLFHQEKRILEISTLPDGIEEIELYEFNGTISHWPSSLKKIVFNECPRLPDNLPSTLEEITFLCAPPSIAYDERIERDLGLQLKFSSMEGVEGIVVIYQRPTQADVAAVENN